MKATRWILLSVIAVLIVLFIAFDVHEYLRLEALKAHQAELESWVAERPWTSAGVFMAIYVLVTALSLPGAAVMTLVGGALFGLGWGLLLVSFASTVGATLAMLISRFFLRGWVSQRFGRQLEPIDRGIERDGAFYLFALRLVPAFPFFIINLAMGLTGIRVRTFWWVSQLGMLPGTLVYVNAGRELAQVESLGGILSPGLIGAFVLLGLFPLVARKILDWVKARRVYRGWRKPERFDRNLVVIGAGSGGLVSAYIAAAVKAQVSLVEKNEMGGDCLNTGCVPSKTLIRSARLAADIKRAHRLGYSQASAEVDFAKVMERVHGAIAEIAPHDSVERYNDLGVEVFQEAACITSPWTVEVGDRTLTTRNIIIATGGRPKVPPIPGLEQMDLYTSETVWNLRERPERLLVIGGGLIGCELAQAFQRLGCQVIQIQRGERILPSEDPEVSELVMQSLLEDGVELLLRHNPESFARTGGVQQVTLRNLETDQCHTRHFDAVLVATGRAANTDGFGAQTLELALREDGTLETDDYLATRFPNIYAVGDVTGPYQLTHAASHQAWYAAVNALFGPFRRFRVDYRVMPHCVFTDPEVARVGLSETEARDQKVPFEVTRYELAELDRAIAEDARTGFVKVLTAPGKDRILGVTIVGEHAGELIAEYVLAMKHNLGLNKILGTVHSYPTMAEANKYAAGNWKKAHAPQKLLRWVGRFHKWRLD
ncbi:Pyruvate/2-oxoglutarate dehydrogenase complex, dihydrolipoamide dehydrogenase (E3) component [Halopseudomonas xinjiangensis]|uniref:Pyruvate/2-oxoglutarate dehydrogenase complex, dihydrolipoamide dehydrogenase (E3) component n=1 Tax=Halopseudomonas xinjiangensis TaxID=487184 RepID=A0A1H1NHF5_9GAMM|nr:bifunctional TVP38/TMEM64 family protein/FAD-dependent oxidoreductase [Halopseudomonas xinjiangensis]SDR98270.1 Pyruvate/2-oxoglutarate dehydrogenase complex, dihydrolipoamide dehydrogenase (E3) component [Halopseudomonas xinjiangensis]